MLRQQDHVDPILIDLRPLKQIPERGIFNLPPLRPRKKLAIFCVRLRKLVRNRQRLRLIFNRQQCRDLRPAQRLRRAPGNRLAIQRNPQRHEHAQQDDRRRKRNQKTVESHASLQL